MLRLLMHHRDLAEILTVGSPSTWNFKVSSLDRRGLVRHLVSTGHKETRYRGGRKRRLAFRHKLILAARA